MQFTTTIHIQLYATLQKTLPTTLNNVIPLLLPGSSLSPFLNKLTINPSLHSLGTVSSCQKAGAADPPFL